MAQASDAGAAAMSDTLGTSLGRSARMLAIIPPSRHAYSFVVASALFAALAGCRDRGGDTACEVADDFGERVVTPCTTQVVLEDQGNGFRPQPPEGSTCRGEESFSVDLESGDFAWQLCEFSPSAPWQRSEGSRVLSESELDALQGALRDVTVARVNEGCGADKPTLTISVGDGEGEQTYTDSFYSCSDPNKLYVNGIDGAFQAVRELASAQ
jgi:hypothetical protein